MGVYLSFLEFLDKVFHCVELGLEDLGVCLGVCYDFFHGVYLGLEGVGIDWLGVSFDACDEAFHGVYLGLEDLGV